jgi:hypothetical protein
MCMLIMMLPGSQEMPVAVCGQCNGLSNVCTGILCCCHQQVVTRQVTHLSTASQALNAGGVAHGDRQPASMQLAPKQPPNRVCKMWRCRALWRPYWVARPAAQWVIAFNTGYVGGLVLPAEACLTLRSAAGSTSACSWQ